MAELPGGTPVRGGTLKLAVITGGNTETLVAPLVVQYGDYARAYMLYSWLFYMNQAANAVIPGLALSAESNANATMWTLHLRPDVYWHDGSPFTADDVLWTFYAWSMPSAYVYGTFHGLVDFVNMRKRDALTVEIPLLSGFAAFPSLLVYENNGVIKNGMSDKDIARNPIGTGPFMYKSFTPGNSYSASHEEPALLGERENRTSTKSSSILRFRSRPHCSTITHFRVETSIWSPTLISRSHVDKWRQRAYRLWPVHRTSRA